MLSPRFPLASIYLCLSLPLAACGADDPAKTGADAGDPQSADGAVKSDAAPAPDAMEPPPTELVLEGGLHGDEGNDPDRFGASVSVAGGWMVVGSYWASPDEFRQGAAYVYQKTDGGWSPAGKLFAADGDTHASFGLSVTNSADTIAVGAWWQNAPAGAVYLYERSGTAWEPAGTITSGEESVETFGRHVDLRGETLLAASGAEAIWMDPVNSVQSLVRAYRKQGDTWTADGDLAPTGSGDNGFGGAIAVDGDTALVAAPYDSTEGEEAGAVFVYQRQSAGNWTRVGDLYPATPDEQYFGRAIDLAGNRAVIASDSGTYLYTRDTPTSGFSKAHTFAQAAGWGAVSTDGGRIAIGAGLSPHVYVEYGGEWLYFELPGYGNATVVAGDTVITASPGDNFAGSANVLRLE